MYVLYMSRNVRDNMTRTLTTYLYIHSNNTHSHLTKLITAEIEYYNKTVQKTKHIHTTTPRTHSLCHINETASTAYIKNELRGIAHRLSIMRY